MYHLHQDKPPKEDKNKNNESSKQKSVEEKSSEGKTNYNVPTFSWVVNSCHEHLQG